MLLCKLKQRNICQLINKHITLLHVTCIVTYICYIFPLISKSTIQNLYFLSFNLARELNTFVTSGVLWQTSLCKVGSIVATIPKAKTIIGPMSPALLDGGGSWKLGVTGERD